MTNDQLQDTADSFWILIQNTNQNADAIRVFLEKSRADGSWPSIQNLIQIKMDEEKSLKLKTNNK